MPIQELIIATGQTCVMVFLSTLIATLMGIGLAATLVLWQPQGLHPHPLVHRCLSTVINIVRSLPFIILLIAIIPFTRLITGSSIGTAAAVVPLTIAAIAFIARLIEANLNEVSKGLIEAGLTMGASPKQILWHILLPESLPGIINSITVTAINLVGYSAMAGVVGGGGLGDVAIRYGYQRFDTEIMLTTVIILIILVQCMQWCGDSFARRLTH